VTKEEILEKYKELKFQFDSWHKNCFNYTSKYEGKSIAITAPMYDYRSSFEKEMSIKELLNESDFSLISIFINMKKVESEK